MTDPDLVALFVAPLERAGIEYMVTGGVASVVYGDPRFTRDIDLVVELDARIVPRFMNAFAGTDFYVPPEEALLEEVGRREGGHFKVIHRDTALRADIYLAGEERSPGGRSVHGCVSCEAYLPCVAVPLCPAAVAFWRYSI